MRPFWICSMFLLHCTGSTAFRLQRPELEYVLSQLAECPESAEAFQPPLRLKMGMSQMSSNEPYTRLACSRQVVFQDMRCHFQDTPRAGQRHGQGERWGDNLDGQNCARPPPALHCLAEDTRLFPAELLRPTAIRCDIELRSQACKRCYFI